MAVNDLYVLTVHYKSADAIVQFSMGYRMDSGTYGVSTGLAVCAKFVASYLPNLLLALSDECEVDQISFDPVTNVTELGGVANLNNALGLVVGQALPANMAALIHPKTVAPNSKHNGRIYLAGVAEGSIVAGVFDAPSLALIQTFADDLFVDLVPDSPEDATFGPIVISRFENGIKRVPPVGFDILAPLAKNEPRQQQRRMTPRLGLS